MNRKIATITLNPAYDLVGLIPQIISGEVNIVKTAGLYPAGKGINVAKVLKNLGIHVTVGGFLGKDNAEGFQQLFNNMGIENRFTLIDGRTRINVKLTENSGDVTDFNFSGFDVSNANWQRFVRDTLQWVSQYDMVCVSGSLPSGINVNDFTLWMQQLKQACPFVIFDSSRDALIAGLKTSPWLVKPNLRELETWAGRALPTLTDVVNTAQALYSHGITHVIVSLGAEGALWFHSSGIWLARPPKCDIISTVGAGDSMVAGLIYGLIMGETSEHTLRLATAISAIAVNQANVGLADKEQLISMMMRVDIQPLTAS